MFSKKIYGGVIKTGQAGQMKAGIDQSFDFAMMVSDQPLHCIIYRVAANPD